MSSLAGLLPGRIAIVTCYRPHDYATFCQSFLFPLHLTELYDQCLI